MTLTQQLAGLLTTVIVLVLTRLIDKYTGTGGATATTQVDKTSPTDPIETTDTGGTDG
jgi:hypothetical protein